MLNALSSAATGLDAQQHKIASLANDLANVGTDGYKSSIVDFDEQMAQTLRAPGEPNGANTQLPVGIQLGNGVKVTGISKNFAAGPVKMTYNPQDLMIQGAGFFQVQDMNGEVCVTRKGNFKKDANGILQLTSGAKLFPMIQIPPNAMNFYVTPQGEVYARLQDGSDQNIGQIQLATFQNPQGLLSVADGLFKATAASGPMMIQNPGTTGLGTILQGALEGSNVNVANTMIDMIATQRAYEMGTKVMSTVDQMLGATVNVR